MNIAVEKLQERGACKAGIATFARAFPGGLDVAEWTPECQLGVMMHEELRRHLGWAWAFGVLPQWSMWKWNLSYADLARAGLMRADLARADLRRADLADADLRRANLVGADLTGADLTGANLVGADLIGAYIACANFTDVNLTDARWDNRPPPAGWVCIDGRLRVAA